MEALTLLALSREYGNTLYRVIIFPPSLLRICKLLALTGGAVGVAHRVWGNCPETKDTGRPQEGGAKSTNAHQARSSFLLPALHLCGFMFFITATDSLES